ncbi:MAG: methionyl-tRNA formyltransferase [bacterium]|nr:methionyl-tRNA formyltransferase [bacterium]
MRIGFFGTPDIASYCLEELLKKYEIAFVVSSEDKMCGRGRTVRFCEAKEAAVCQDITVLQPCSLDEPEFYEEIQQFNADIFVVVAFGKIIPRKIFDLPRLKTINLHPSLLPKYRGAAPVEWALMNGEAATGITVQLINEKLDAGDIVLQKQVALDQEIGAKELYEIVRPQGAALIDEAIQLLDAGKAELKQQDHEEATYCGKIDRETAHIDWNKPAEEIHNRVRGLNNKSGAWTTFRGKSIKIWKTALFTEPLEKEPAPGAIVKLGKKKLLAGTGSGIIELQQLQPEGKKVIESQAFINGYRISEDHFDSA